MTNRELFEERQAEEHVEQLEIYLDEYNARIMPCKGGGYALSFCDGTETEPMTLEEIDEYLEDHRLMTPEEYEESLAEQAANEGD